MSNYTAPYGYGPSEPDSCWVTHIRCEGCDNPTDIEDISDANYCIGCAPECENCGEFSIDWEIFQDATICMCCYEIIYECEVCNEETLKEYIDADANYACKSCYEKNPRESNEGLGYYTMGHNRSPID